MYFKKKPNDIIYMNKDTISWKLIDLFFKDNPNIISKHHLDSYNAFFDKGITNIFNNQNPIPFNKEYDNEINKFKYQCKLYLGGKNGDKIYYGKPVIYDKTNDTERQHFMYPNEARLRNMSYCFTIHYDILIEYKILIEKNNNLKGMEKYEVHTSEQTIEKIYLGKFPIMLQSNLCILKGLDKNVRYNLGECKNDPGGYFIIDGKEKVIMTQEGRANNVLYIKDKVNDIYSHAAEIRSVSEDTSKPIRTLSVRMVAEQDNKKNGHIVVNVPNVRLPVPLFILMRALGIISDKEIIETCLHDMEKWEDYIELFRPSIHDAGNIFTQESAIKYLSSLLKIKTKENLNHILSNYFLPHMGEYNFIGKAKYIGYVVKRLLCVYTGLEKPTNRDGYSYKRLEVSGMLINELFREYFILQTKNMHLKMEEKYYYNSSKNSEGTAMYQNLDFTNLFENNKQYILSQRIVEEGFRKAFKGNWGATAHTKRLGIVQDLTRLSFFSFVSQLRKTNLPIAGQAGKLVGPRLLNGTQWGLLCPVHSPDGGNIGFHKHLSTSTHITSGTSGYNYIFYFRKMGLKLLEECSNKFISQTAKVFVNGIWVGNIRNPKETVDRIKMHRRNNMIDIYTSIRFNTKLNEIVIFSDAGRPTRPLFYITDQNSLSYEKENILKMLANKSLSWEQCIKGLNSGDDNLLEKSKKIELTYKENHGKNACILEYIDTQEAEGIILAKSTYKIEEYIQNNVTHFEIHPSLILSLMANQIIFPEHNQYPRNAFSCGQGKQGVSVPHSNYQNRIDKSLFVLNYGQTPLTKSRYLSYVTNEEHPYGENAIVAIMCYTGYNVEDAVIINEGSLNRGLFGTTYFNMYEAREEITNSGGETFETLFMNIEDNEVVELNSKYDYSKLDKKTGLIKENTIVDDKTIVIGKASRNATLSEKYSDSSVKPKKGQTGIVDKSFITSNEEGKRVAKVRIRAQRTPAIGDKFCSRAGQKGTIGIILPEIDMPTTAEGIKPDIIVNPHAMPSRMTIGHLVEALISKSAVHTGAFGDCTAFKNLGPKYKDFGKVLTSLGYHSSGNEYLYNGMTGEQLESEIYIGPTYYLRLKHMPKDKINYRARGPRTTLTRQTVQGRANDGGLRIGEMDRDCLIGHGMSYFIKDSMLVRGDEFYMAVCNKSGLIAIYNERKNIFLSPIADGPIQFTGELSDDLNIINVSKFGRDFSIVRVPYAFKLLMQELKTMNIQMRIVTDKNVNQLMSMSSGDDIYKLQFLDKHKYTTDKNYSRVNQDRFNNVSRFYDEAVDDMVMDENKLVDISEEWGGTFEQEKTNIILPNNSLYGNEDWGETFDNPFTQSIQEKTNIESTDSSKKKDDRFKIGDIIVLKENPTIKYKIIDYEWDEDKYYLNELDSNDDQEFEGYGSEFMTPPPSPTNRPTSPDYSPDEPPNMQNVTDDTKQSDNNDQNISSITLGEEEPWMKMDEDEDEDEDEELVQLMKGGEKVLSSIVVDNTTQDLDILVDNDDNNDENGGESNDDENENESVKKDITIDK
jgi:DNA-directed RNA polymerase II subunit RPB2